MDYWSVGVLCLFRIAPAQRVGDAFKACSFVRLPRAKALGCSVKWLTVCRAGGVDRVEQSAVIVKGFTSCYPIGKSSRLPNCGHG